MRTFDNSDQEIIKKIIYGNGYARSLINIIDFEENLQHTRIQVDITNKTACFLFEMENNTPTDEETRYGIEKHKQLIEILIKHLLLFRYIESNELAFFFDPTNSSNPSIQFGAGAVNLPSFSIPINDQSIIDLLIKYIQKEIIPSPSLRELAKNNFKSSDELKFNSQQFATWAAIIVSLILGLYGMYNDNQNSITQENQFHQQIQSNKSIANEISTKLEQLNNSNTNYNKILNKATIDTATTCKTNNIYPQRLNIDIKISNDIKHKNQSQNITKTWCGIASQPHK